MTNKTLRDEFAMVALTGIITEGGLSQYDTKSYAEDAYLMADAMIAARGTLESTNDDGWIEWKGGECPVAAGTKVSVRFGDGREETDNAPEDWGWRHVRCIKVDIIAYRVVEDAV